MSQAAGTIERIAIELSKLLQPIALDVSTPADAKVFFARMGFALTDAQVASLAGPLQASAGGASDLGQLAAAIAAAIAADNSAAASAKGLESIQRIVQVINGLSALGSQLAGIVGAPAAVISKRILDHLILGYLSATPELNDTLDLIGLLDREEHNEESADPDAPPFTIANYRFDLIGAWFSDPKARLAALYDWGGAFDGRKLFERLERILSRAGLPVLFDDTGAAPRLDLVVLDAVPKTDVAPPGLLVRMKTDIAPSTQTIDLGPDASAELKLEFQIPRNMGIALQPNGAVTFIPPTPSGTFKGELFLTVTAEQKTTTEPILLLGQAGGSRLEMQSFTFVAGTTATWDGTRGNGSFLLEGTARDLKVVIDTTGGDGFLSKIMPATRIEAVFTTTVGVSTESGLYFRGSGALEVRLPIHIDIGPVAVEALTIAAKLDGGGIPTSIGANLRANLGPLVAVVENVGVTATFTFPPGNTGNLGPVNFGLGFKPPNGVGLTLDVGIVRGGGFLYFDFDRQEYAGVLELAIAEIVTVKAIGLITTKMPDGSKGFSLLIIITAEFGTGIQLGFGFTLLGLGGILGLNRTMNLQPLVEGVRSGAVNSIMFPENPVANAPRIINDLRVIFPPYEGRFLIGPMAKLGWGTPTLVSVSVGIIIEITGNIAIVGVLKIAIPAEEAPLIVIQANFVGAIEFDKQRIYFFAALFESRIVFLTLEGEMGLLIAWGPDANFVISVGGFHPRFNPPPLPFPNPKRIAVSLLNTDIARIRTETYFAVTSNTVQFGSSTEVMFDVGVARVDGHLAFDALFQFSPFYFSIQISAHISLKVFGVGLFGITLNFQLEGPAPYRAHGTGSLSLFFFDVSADFDITWGDAKDTTLPPIAVMRLLHREFDKLESWKAELPVDSHLLVSLRKLPADEAAHVLHPLGALRVSQRAVPLDVKIDKVGNQKPSDANDFTLIAVAGLVKVDSADEQFAKAQYLQMSDADKLSQRAFDPMHGGAILSSGSQQLGAAKMAKRRVRYEQTIIDTNYLSFTRRFRGFTRGFFQHFFKGAAITKSDLSQQRRTELNPFADKVKVGVGTYTVANTENNKAFSAQATHFASEAHAQQFIAAEVAAHPELHDTLHVVASYEVAA